MPAMSNNSKASDERSKMKTKFITNLIEMKQNIQSVEKNEKTSLLDRKNKYWQSIWRGGGVGGEHSSHSDCVSLSKLIDQSIFNSALTKA